MIIFSFRYLKIFHNRLIQNFMNNNVMNTFFSIPSLRNRLLVIVISVFRLDPILLPVSELT